jgi:hypothetical protein
VPSEDGGRSARACLPGQALDALQGYIDGAVAELADVERHQRPDGPNAGLADHDATFVPQLGDQRDDVASFSDVELVAVGGRVLPVRGVRVMVDGSKRTQRPGTRWLATEAALDKLLGGHPGRCNRRDVARLNDHRRGQAGWRDRTVPRFGPEVLDFGKILEALQVLAAQFNGSKVEQGTC